MKLPFKKEKVIELVLKHVLDDPENREKVKDIAKIIAKIGYKFDAKKRTLLLDFTDVKKEGLGWKVYIVLDRESKKGFSFEI